MAEAEAQKSEATSSEEAANEDNRPSAKELTRDHASRELIFGIVGHVGSGTSTVAKNLESILVDQVIDDIKYECVTVHAREVIERWSHKVGEVYPSERPFTISDVERFQDLGDQMRSDGDHAAVARGAILQIRELRARMQKVEIAEDTPVVPDGCPRA